MGHEQLELMETAVTAGIIGMIVAGTLVTALMVWLRVR